MKKLKIVLLGVVASGLFLTSCNKDDDKDNNKASINGKWYYSKEGTGTNGQEVLVDYADNIPGCSKDYVEFLDNNVLKDTYYVDEQCNTEEELSSYTYENNNLTVIYAGETSVAEVVNLSNDELKIRQVAEVIDGQTIFDYVVFTRNQ